MVSEKCKELMRLVIQDLSRSDEVKRLIETLEQKEYRRIVDLYFTLPSDERSHIKLLLDVSTDAAGKQTQPQPIGSDLARIEATGRRVAAALNFNPQPEGGPETPHPPRHRPARPTRHPPVRAYPEGGVLAESIKSFCDDHKPRLKYLGMHTAIDALTACKSVDGTPYDFHYEIKAYRNDGVYILKMPGRGHRTSPEDTDAMEHGYG